MGYGDLGSYGSPDIKTPNIDGLAKAGVRFTQFYANGSTCTPTRAGLITGRYQQRVAMERPLSHESSPDGKLGLAATGHSLPQLLHNHGYATGADRQVAPRLPAAVQSEGARLRVVLRLQGRLHRLLPAHRRRRAVRICSRTTPPVKVDGYMTDLITDRSVRFIDANARSPFFLEVAYNVPHWPYQVPDHPSTAIDKARHVFAYDENPGTRADYVKMLERADQGVGQILAALDQQRPRQQHAGDLHQRQRRRMAVAQCAAVQPQVLGLRRRDSGAGDHALARTDPCRRGHGAGRHHDGSQRDDPRSRGRGCARGRETGRHQPVAAACAAAPRRSPARCSGASSIPT